MKKMIKKDEELLLQCIEDAITLEPSLIAYREFTNFKCYMELDIYDFRRTIAIKNLEKSLLFCYNKTKDAKFLNAFHTLHFYINEIEFLQ